LNGSAGTEKALSGIEMTLRGICVIAGQRDSGSEKVCAREVKRVVGCLKERYRFARVDESNRLSRFCVREPRPRPIQTDAHVRIVRVSRLLERALDDRFSPGELAHVAEDVAKEDRVPHCKRYVARPLDFLDAALK
jgi:hypothetical protein